MHGLVCYEFNTLKKLAEKAFEKNMLVVFDGDGESFCQYINKLYSQSNRLIHVSSWAEKKDVHMITLDDLPDQGKKSVTILKWD